MLRTTLLCIAVYASLLVGSGNHTETLPEELLQKMCKLPFSIGMQTNLYIPPPWNVPFSPAVIQATQTAISTSSLIGVVTVTPGAVTQGARGALALAVVNCQDNTDLNTDPLDWGMSPTGLVVGNSELSYYEGAVVGNWLLWGGVVAGLSAAARYFGQAKLRYPGVLILPTMFLWPAIASSSVTLLRFGEAGQQALGAISMLAELGVTGLILVPVLPQNFKAEWDPTTLKWHDLEKESGFVHRYGMLFKDYGFARYWFVGVESLFSLSAGALDGFGASQSSCANVLGAGISCYGLYALAVCTTLPNRFKFDKVYLVVLATSQLSGMLLNYAGNKVNSTNMQTVGAGIMTVTQWLVTARGVYDSIRQFRSLYKYVRSLSNWKEALGVLTKKDSTKNLQSLVSENPFEGDTELKALDPLGVRLIQAVSRSGTPASTASSITSPPQGNKSPLEDDVSGIFDSEPVRPLNPDSGFEIRDLLEVDSDFKNEPTKIGTVPQERAPTAASNDLERFFMGNGETETWQQNLLMQTLDPPPMKTSAKLRANPLRRYSVVEKGPTIPASSDLVAHEDEGSSKHQDDSQANVEDASL